MSVKLTKPMTTHLYLDHAATTPLAPEVQAAMSLAAEGQNAWANASSLHGLGQEANTLLEEARAQVARCLGVSENSSLTWTSGGTESNNLVLLGLAFAELAKPPADQKKHLVISPIEHSAVLDPAQWLANQWGFELSYPAVTTEGSITPQALEAVLREDTLLVSIGHANNEVGIIQDIQALGHVCRQRRVLFHTDAVQTVGKLPLNLESLSVDYLSCSGHKFYGPRATGLLYRHPEAPKPLAIYRGGGQESGQRPGTVNTLGAVGLAKALSLCCERQASETERLRELAERFKTVLVSELGSLAEGLVVNSPSEPSRCLPGLVHLSVPPGEGEALVLQLAMRGVAISSGSACNTHKVEPSRVVLALGKSEAVAKATLRFSFGYGTTWKALEEALPAIVSVLKKPLKKARPASSQGPSPIN